MQSQVKTYHALMLLLIVFVTSCAAKKEPFPEPLIGIDLENVSKGDKVPFDGILMSPSYFQNYMQWKCKEEGKCN